MTPEGHSSLGHNVATYRKMEGISAAELADKAGEGLTRSVIANLENGRKDDVTVRQLIALATALNVPPAALVVDVLHPWDATPYRHPGIVTIDMTLDGAILGSKEGQISNLQFFEWFGGHGIKPKQDTQGAKKLTDTVIPAVLSFDRAIFDLLLTSAALTEARRFFDTDEESLSAAHRVEYAESALRASARSVLAWNDLLSALGVENQETEISVRLVLAKFGITPESLD